MLGASVYNVEQFHRMFDKVGPQNFNARALLDHALYDALGKCLHQPVYNLIGGLCQERIPLEWSISMADDIAHMIADAERAVTEFGMRVLCMKAEHKKGWREDVRNFLAIRETVGSDITLGMDPNTGWSVSETISVLRDLDRTCVV